MTFGKVFNLYQMIESQKGSNSDLSLDIFRKKVTLYFCIVVLAFLCTINFTIFLQLGLQNGLRGRVLDKTNISSEVYKISRL